jgi:hypothetical protein
VVVDVSTVVGVIVALDVIAADPVVVVRKNGNIVLDSVKVDLVVASAGDNGSVLFDSVYYKEEEAE